VLVAVTIIAAVYLLWQIRFALLTVFAAALLAVLLLALADQLRRLVPMRRGWALGITSAAILVLIAGLIWLVGSNVRSQFDELWDALPQAASSIEQRWGVEVSEAIEPQGGADAAGRGAAGEEPSAGPPARQGAAGRGEATPTAMADPGGLQSAIASRLTNWIAAYGLSVVDAVVGVVLVVVAGVYLAADPALYRSGAVKLFPPAHHRLADETMIEIGETLQLWLLGKLISMILIGLLTGLGTWAIGLPTPLALGIFAGCTEFVPIIGPIVGAVPALVLAATDGFTTVVWTLLLFLGIQQIESNIIAPLVEGRMVMIPPALFVLGVGIFGGIFGILGLILSGPLLAASYVAVKKLWMREALNESTPLPTDPVQR
jgi:predicted PurR-regulated permease PerM